MRRDIAVQNLVRSREVEIVQTFHRLFDAGGLGGVQKMILSGMAAGFMLYVLSKVTEDLSKAELMHIRQQARARPVVRLPFRASLRTVEIVEKAREQGQPRQHSQHPAKHRQRYPLSGLACFYRCCRNASGLCS